MLDYFNQVNQVAVEFSRLVATHFVGLSEEADTWTQLFGVGSTTFLLYNHYLNIESIPETRMGAGDHTDVGFLTFLLTDNHRGLQAFVDGEWRYVQPKRGAFIVTIGDVVERWSNGVFPSTRHRVMTSGDRRMETIVIRLHFSLDPN